MSRRHVTAALAGATEVTGTLLAPVGRAARGVRRSMGASQATIRAALTSAGRCPPGYDGTFANPEPMAVVDAADSAPLLLDWVRRDDRGRPRAPVPVVRPVLPELAAPLAATWLGHATVLLELDGRWILVDPVWSDRASPSAAIGPRRTHPVPLPLGDLPALSAVVISHDHYDHLDVATIDTLVRTQETTFLVPLGIGSHLRQWGVPDDRIVELGWGESHELDGLRLTCTRARHFSGRGFRRNLTLWASWVLAGPQHRVFFGGDTGYTDAFARIGAEHGPFDLTLLPIGAYDRRWPDIHLDPEEAVRVHREVGGRLLLPIHWATFDLAFHAWAEPVERLVEAVGDEVTLALPRPGERFAIGAAEGEAEPPPTARWWAAPARSDDRAPDRPGEAAGLPEA